MIHAFIPLFSHPAPRISASLAILRPMLMRACHVFSILTEVVQVLLPCLAYR
jgi:hypothetical protein